MGVTREGPQVVPPWPGRKRVEHGPKLEGTSTAGQEKYFGRAGKGQYWDVEHKMSVLESLQETPTAQ